MVNFQIGLLVSLLLCSLSVWAEVKVYPKTVQLGEPITLVFLGEKIEQDFAQMDKAPIRQNFEIYDVEGYSDRVRLTLYPLQTGTLRLPEMQQGQIAFKGVDIEVQENSEVQLIWQHPLDSEPLFAQQPYLWQVTVKGDSALSIELEAHPHPKELSKSAFQSAPVRVETGLFGDERHFVLAYWAEQSVQQLVLRSPVIRVKNRSQKTWLFFDKSQKVDVKPLPNYLPLRMPVGKLQLEAQSLPFWLEVGQLTLWKIRLLAQNVQADLLPNLAQQFESTPKGLEWLTPSTEVLQTWSQKGWQTQQSWQLPFRVNQLGWVVMPSLRLTYFDTETRQLQDVWIPGSFHILVPSWLVMLFKGFALLSLILVVALLALLVKGHWLKWRAQKAIVAAQNVTDVWLALRNYDLAKVLASQIGEKPAPFNPESLTLEAGLLRAEWHHHAKVSHETLLLIEALNKHFYAYETPQNLKSCQELAQAWLQKQSVFYRLVNELRTIRYFFNATPKA